VGEPDGEESLRGLGTTGGIEMYLLIGVILSGVVLVIYLRRGQNAVWGGATLGILVGGVVGLIKGDVLNFLGWGFIG
jgi:hypothetical protein